MTDGQLSQGKISRKETYRGLILETNQSNKLSASVLDIVNQSRKGNGSLIPCCGIHESSRRGLSLLHWGRKSVRDMQPDREDAIKKILEVGHQVSVTLDFGVSK
jgi:hypothetical protein